MSLGSRRLFSFLLGWHNFKIESTCNHKQKSRGLGCKRKVLWVLFSTLTQRRPKGGERKGESKRASHPWVGVRTMYMYSVQKAQCTKIQSVLCMNDKPSLETANSPEHWFLRVLPRQSFSYDKVRNLLLMNGLDCYAPRLAKARVSFALV